MLRSNSWSSLVRTYLSGETTPSIQLLLLSPPTATPVSSLTSDPSGGGESIASSSSSLTSDTTSAWLNLGEAISSSTEGVGWWVWQETSPGREVTVSAGDLSDEE